MNKMKPLTWDELKNYIGVPTFARFETYGWPPLANGKDGYWSIITEVDPNGNYHIHKTEDDTLLGETIVSRNGFMKKYQIFPEEYRGEVSFHTEIRNRGDYPPREELKEKIRLQSFRSIAEEYGIKSESTIRNWCKKLNLPHCKTEIMKYSDEEWKLI